MAASGGTWKGGKFKAAGGGGGGATATAAPKPKFANDRSAADAVARELSANGISANVWQRGSASPRVYIRGSGGARGFIEIEGGKAYGNLTGYGRSGDAINIARQLLS